MLMVCRSIPFTKVMLMKQLLSVDSEKTQRLKRRPFDFVPEITIITAFVEEGKTIFIHIRI